MTKKDNLIRAKIIKGLEIAHKKLIQTKKDRNLDLVVSDNGKVVHILSKDL
jgi:hypothetical protein